MRIGLSVVMVLLKFGIGLFLVVKMGVEIVRVMVVIERRV